MNINHSGIEFRDIYSKKFTRLNWKLVDEIFLVQGSIIKDADGIHFPRSRIVFKLKENQNLLTRIHKYTCDKNQVYAVSSYLSKKTLKELLPELKEKKYADLKISYKNKLRLNAKS